MTEQEVWKDIVKYDNYEVSSFGNVKNKKTGRILKPNNCGGYAAIGLPNNKTTQIHRLVAMAFILNPENKPQVNHIDKNKLNNNLSNLEWCTNKENSIHRSNGVIQTTNQNLTVWRMDLITGEKLEKYSSILEASKWVEDNCGNKLLNISSGVSCACRGVYKSSFGFKWEIDKSVDNLSEDEIWKEINIENENTKGYYISSLGRFKNLKEVIMKDYKSHHSGYIYVRVNIKKYALHRLVAVTFIENIENKPLVNHIDGNKLNNTLINLEWSTFHENIVHAHKTGLLKCFTRPIVQYDLEMNKINEFKSIVEASKKLNINIGGIKAVLYKKQNTTKGFIFKYLE